jgi:hypothetical protein
MLELEKKEAKLLKDCCDNYYDDEVEGASSVLAKIKQRLQNDLCIDLDKVEAQILYNCLDRDIHDFYSQIEHKKDCQILEQIQSKLQNLLKKLD